MVIIPQSDIVQRTFLERQERFIRLYLALSQNESVRYLRQKTPIMRKVGDICVGTFNENMTTREQADVYLQSPPYSLEDAMVGKISPLSDAQKRIIECLTGDSTVQQHFSHGLMGDLESNCYNVALALTNAYVPHLNGVKRQRNTFQQERYTE